MKIIFTNKEKEMILRLKNKIKNTDGNINITPINKSVRGISVEENEISFSEELVCDFLKLVKDMLVGILSLAPIAKLVFKDILKKGREFESKWEVKNHEE